MNTRLKQMNTLLSKEIKIKTQEHLNEELFKYVELKNNRYVLNLSKEKCQQMGISPLEYQRVVVDLEKTNRFIAEVEKGSGLILQKIDYNKKLSGTLRANGQETVVAKFSVPNGVKFISFECYSFVAKLPVFTCRTVSQGEPRMKIVNGNPLKPTKIDVPIVASNTAVQIYFQTSDSNGGYANWETKY